MLVSERDNSLLNEYSPEDRRSGGVNGPVWSKKLVSRLLTGHMCVVPKSPSFKEETGPAPAPSVC